MGVKQFCFDLVCRKMCIMKRIVFSVKCALHWLIAVEEEQAGQSTSLYDKHCPVCLSLAYLGTQSIWSHYCKTNNVTEREKLPVFIHWTEPLLQLIERDSNSMLT